MPSPEFEWKPRPAVGVELGAAQGPNAAETFGLAIADVLLPELSGLSDSTFQW